MQLIKKMFGRAPGGGLGADSAQFHESETTGQEGSRNAPRRELIHVVLSDSMRRHGIPSAWIDCRVLSVVTRNRKTGMHMQLIVRDGVDRLLTYVPAFQRSFMEEIVRFDPRVDDWLLSLSWQFQNLNARVAAVMPDPITWAPSVAAHLTPMGAVPALAAAGRLPVEPLVAVASPAVVPESPPPHPAVAASVTAPAALGDQEVLEDLQALYAIRDAALRQGRPGPKPATCARDFESTHPGAEDEPARHPSQPPAW